MAQPNKIVKVSVVMATYNGEKYLREQLDSILAQTYPIYEIIIQDDGSTDGTWNFLKSYSKSSSIIKLFHNESAKGVNSNFFSAFERAAGDFIAVSDQDDIWLPNKLERLLENIGDNLLISSMSHPFIDGTEKQDKSVYDGRVPNVSLLRLVHIGCCPGHTMLFKKNLLRYIKPSFKNYFTYDALLSVVSSAIGTLVFLPEVLVLQRRHVSAFTYNAPENRSKSIINIIHVVNRDINLYFSTIDAQRVKAVLWLEVLSSLEGLTDNARDVYHYLELVTKRGCYPFLRRCFFCIKHNKEVLYADDEPNSAYRLLRSAFFPVSCSAYLRYLVK